MHFGCSADDNYADHIHDKNAHNASNRDAWASMENVRGRVVPYNPAQIAGLWSLRMGYSGPRRKKSICMDSLQGQWATWSEH
jgi:hypothetical protein